MTNRTPYVAQALPDLLRERQPLNWLVEHWIEAGTLAVLVGPEGSFKSFVAIDWSMSVATGRDWQGCRVSRGRVLYIAGEGRTGVIRRMRGWCQYHEATADDLLLGGSPIELVGIHDADRIAELGRFELVVIDTLARNFGPGNENDAQDMSRAVQHADRIRELTGGTVLIVHHAPLEGRDEGKLRPRGSSALAGAADAIFTCQYDREAKVITVGNVKQKDAMAAESRFLGFDVVDLGEQDNFGNEITTVVLRGTDSRPAARLPAGSRHQRRLVQELRARANGSPDLLVSIRDITAGMDMHRQTRKRLEDWFMEQPWVTPSVGGHRVDIGALPRG